MELSVIGISHRTAPVDVRERFALPGELAGTLLRTIHYENVFEEALILDTCNRTEVYFVAAGPQDPLGYLLAHVARLKKIDPLRDTSAFYRHDGLPAVRHLFRTAASLESQIVGEDQVLGQLKDAYRLALEQRTARFLLNKVLHWAFRVGKAVRTDTDLGRGSASIAQAAVELAEQIFSALAGKAAMLVGAGQTAELAAGQLVGRGIDRVIVANRTLGRAEQVAERILTGRAGGGAPLPAAGRQEQADGAAGPVRCPALPRLLAEPGETVSGASGPSDRPGPTTQAIALEDIPGAISDVDLVICSTGAEGVVLSGNALAETIRRMRRPLFIVDIAVPRDVDPQLGRLDNVFLYNIDDLDRLVARNIERRRREIPRAEAIVQYQVRQFARWLESLEVTPTIKLLQERFRSLQQAEIDRYGRKFTGADRSQLDQFTSGLCNKILHQPIAFLRRLPEDASTSDRLAAVDLIRRMFDLGGPEED